MCTKGIILDGASPVVVLHLRTLRARADAVAPMILVGKASAWPAQYGDLQVLERLQHVVAVAIGIGDVRLWADPKSAVDTRAEMLGKLAVDFFVNFLCALAGVNSHGSILGIGTQGKYCGECEGCQLFFHNAV